MRLRRFSLEGSKLGFLFYEAERVVADASVGHASRVEGRRVRDRQERRLDAVCHNRMKVRRRDLVEEIS